MKFTRQANFRHAAGIAAIGIFLGMSGCMQKSSPEASPPLPSAQTPLQAPGAPGVGQTVFTSDDDAAKAMLAAVAAQDHDQVHQILGPAWKELVSGDNVEDANAFKDFAAHATEHTQVEKKDANISILHIGSDDWTFPIPIAKTADGKWFFDTETGKSEILARRIGANELDTIDICHAYVRAQEQFARKDRDGSDVLKYAQRIVSTAGKMDGLYWDAKPNEAQSPFGPLVGQAEMEGYPSPTPDGPHPPYHGYHFRILKQQGPAAPGGAYNYVINGNMVAGFALVAFPDEYGSSGIMTFIVSQRGKVYQKDLGANTSDLARHMMEYNPDSSWTLVQE